MNVVPPPSCPPDQRVARRGWDLAFVALLLGLTPLYLLGVQTNPPYDSTAFVASYSSYPFSVHPHHPLFGFVLYAFIAGGRLFGLAPMTSGYLQSAFFTAAAQCLFYLLLRRHRVQPMIAILYALLLGLNATALENSTTVELYAGSIFAIVLSLFAFVGLTAQFNPAPRLPPALLFWLSCVLVLLMHVGFVFWVAAAYLALMITAPGWRIKSRWLAHAVGALIPVLLMLGLARIFNQLGESDHRAFFRNYLRMGTLGQNLGRLWESPLFDFAIYGGLILFPAPWGWNKVRRSQSALAWFGVIAAILYWLVYSFWVTDSGSFFYPLIPIFGLFSAIGLNLIYQAGSVPLLRMIVVGALYSILFLILANSRIVLAEGLWHWVFASGFWLFTLLVALVPVTRVANRERNLLAVRASVWLVVFVFSALILSSANYIPRVVASKEPDGQTVLLRAIVAATPPNARIVTQSSAYRPSIQSGRETLSPLDDWNDPEKMAEHRRVLSGWLREMAAGGPPVYLDWKIYARRGFVWLDLRTCSWVDVPLDKLRMTPVTSREALFFRVEFARPGEALSGYGNSEEKTRDSGSGQAPES